MIAAGSTGGHLYPALATAEALYDRLPKLDLHFVGTFGGYERQLVTQFGLPLSQYSEILAGPMHGLGLVQKLWSAFLLGIGTFQSIGLLLGRRPNALLLTGGWMGFPVALAAWLLRVPSVIYLPDIEPGLAIRTLVPLARRVAINIAESEGYFPKSRCTVVGYPLRKEFIASNRLAGIARFGLTEEKRTLLVFGGSLGARSLNNALLAILPELIQDGWQVLHITGKGNWDETIARIGNDHPCGYQVFSYLDDIGLAMAAADLIISRAGASVLAEYPYFSTPSILVPLAHHWRYQQINAQHLADRGVALVLDEEELPSSLLPTIRSMIRNGGKELMKMRQKAAELSVQNGAERLAAELLELSD